MHEEAARETALSSNIYNIYLLLSFQETRGSDGKEGRRRTEHTRKRQAATVAAGGITVTAKIFLGADGPLPR